MSRMEGRTCRAVSAHGFAEAPYNSGQLAPTAPFRSKKQTVRSTKSRKGHFFRANALPIRQDKWVNRNIDRLCLGFGTRLRTKEGTAAANNLIEKLEHDLSRGAVPLTDSTSAGLHD